ncbi:helix-turn-helix domain-containing protein [Rhodovulum sp. DZ06]|uniref:helix-turn-helix domain-containing protein n=1 Tax=Rhodovulum sp. DZ06 TaxID=3425126 RepID=UPI003D32ED2D
MDDPQHPVLRGYDSYEVKLGDELRGHRATRGKSLLDVQRDLRIRASYIDAIENCDPSVMPNKGFVAGYVRAYARYLELDPDVVYGRFCHESGFSGGATPGQGLGRKTGGGADPSLGGLNFASPIGRAQRVGLGVSLSGVMSIMVVAGLVGGLGYGGWTLMQEIQRVEFAPVNEAPDVAEAPAGMTLPTLSLSALAAAPEGRDSARDAALAALYAPQDQAPPALKLRDGPIAAIDPSSVGVFAEARQDAPRRAAGVAVAAAQTDPEGPPRETAMVAILREGAAPGARAADTDTGAGADAANGALPIAEAARLVQQGEAAAAPQDPARSGVWIVASDPAWLRVRLADGSTLVQKTFMRGDRFQLPDGVRGARMRAGNAGAVWIEIDGVLHGPMGRLGGVAKNVSLDADAVREAFDTAAHDPLAPRGDRTEAKLELD